MLNIKQQSGQTLVEVLFALGVVSVCLVALVIAIVTAVRNARFAKNSSLASQYAQEGTEAARRERDTSATWSDFISSFNSDRGLDSGLNWAGCGSANVGIFERCVNFDNTDPSGEISIVTVTVSWSEGGRDHSVEAVTRLTKWNP